MASENAPWWWGQKQNRRGNMNPTTTHLDVDEAVGHAVNKRKVLQDFIRGLKRKRCAVGKDPREKWNVLNKSPIRHLISEGNDTVTVHYCKLRGERSNKKEPFICIQLTRGLNFFFLNSYSTSALLTTGKLVSTTRGSKTVSSVTIITHPFPSSWRALWPRHQQGQGWVQAAGGGVNDALMTVFLVVRWTKLAANLSVGIRHTAVSATLNQKANSLRHKGVERWNNGAPPPQYQQNSFMNLWTPQTALWPQNAALWRAELPIFWLESSTSLP